MREGHHVQVEAARAAAAGVEAAHVHAVVVERGHFHVEIAAHGNKLRDFGVEAEGVGPKRLEKFVLKLSEGEV